MKDQYANYVVQKILQKCTSDQREVLLGLIRNHLTALKKYTYGKHIIAQFEQLCDEGDLSFFLSVSCNYKLLLILFFFFVFNLSFCVCVCVFAGVGNGDTILL